MGSRKTTLHRGRVLAVAVESTGWNKEEVARKAGYSRAAYYKHIVNPDLPYHILMAYGKVIRHDFTREFPDMPKYLLEDPEEPYGTPRTLEEAVLAIAAWKNKYIELLEKYNQLIEEKIARQS